MQENILYAYRIEQWAHARLSNYSDPVGLRTTVP